MFKILNSSRGLMQLALWLESHFPASALWLKPADVCSAQIGGLNLQTHASLALELTDASSKFLSCIFCARSWSINDHRHEIFLADMWMKLEDLFTCGILCYVLHRILFFKCVHVFNFISWYAYHVHIIWICAFYDVERADLTHCGLEMPLDISKLDHHWSR